MDAGSLREAYLAALPGIERRVRHRILLLRLSALACLLYTAALVWAAAAHPPWLPAWTMLRWPLVQKLTMLFGGLFGSWLLLPLLYPFRRTGGLIPRQLEHSGLAARMLAGALRDDALLAELPARLRVRAPWLRPDDYRGQLERLFRITRRYILPSFAPAWLAMRGSPALPLIGAVPMLLVFIPLHIAWQLAPTVVCAFCLPMFIPILQEQLSLQHYLRSELPAAETGRTLAEVERDYRLHLHLNFAEWMAMASPGGYLGFIHVPLVLLLWAPAIAWFWQSGRIMPIVLAPLAHLLLWLAFRAWVRRLDSQVTADLARSDIPGQIARGDLAVTDAKAAGYAYGNGWMKQFDADGPDYSFAMTVAHVCRHARRHLYPSRRWPDEVLLLIGVFGLLTLGIFGAVLLENNVQRSIHGELLLLLAPFHFSIALIMLLVALYMPLSGTASRRLLELLRERIRE